MCMGCVFKHVKARSKCEDSNTKARKWRGAKTRGAYGRYSSMLLYVKKSWRAGGTQSSMCSLLHCLCDTFRSVGPTGHGFHAMV